MNCPLCVDEVLEANHRAGIEIDVCPRCRGVWLDRGELDKLVRSSEPGTRQPPAAAVGAPASPPPGPERKGGRRKSLGSRLGDLLEEALDL